MLVDNDRTENLRKRGWKTRRALENFQRRTKIERRMERILESITRESENSCQAVREWL